MSDSPMDRWRDYDRTKISLGYPADRRQRAAQNEAAYAERLRSGQAWEEFADAFKTLGPRLMASGFAGTDRELAEGYRYLLGFVTAKLTQFMYACGPEAPAFVRAMDDVLKVGLDNPDGINSFHAQIDAGRTYRLFGIQGGERYVELLQFGKSGTVAIRHLSEFQIGPDGRFDIILSRTPHPGNWIETHADAEGLMIRRIQYDWEAERMTEIDIELVGGEQLGGTALPDCLRLPSAAEMGEELESLGQLLTDEVEFWVDYTRAFAAAGPNVFGAAQPLAQSGTNPERSAPKGVWALQPDEALILEFAPPQGVFWSMSLGDVWFRSFDPSHVHSSLNGHQAKLDADGVCRVVIAHADPGFANWLDTAGHHRGVMIFRLVRVSKPEVTTTLLKAADVATHLPAGSVRMTPAERAAVIAARTRGFARRYATPLTSRWQRG